MNTITQLFLSVPVSKFEFSDCLVFGEDYKMKKISKECTNCAFLKTKSPRFLEGPCLLGGEYRSRTGDLLPARQAL